MNSSLLESHQNIDVPTRAKPSTNFSRKIKILAILGTILGLATIALLVYFLKFYNSSSAEHIYTPNVRESFLYNATTTGSVDFQANGTNQHLNKSMELRFVCSGVVGNEIQFIGVLQRYNEYNKTTEEYTTLEFFDLDKSQDGEETSDNTTMPQRSPVFTFSLDAANSMVSKLQVSLDLESNVVESIPTMVALFWPQVKQRRLLSSPSLNQTIVDLGGNSFFIQKMTKDHNKTFGQFWSQTNQGMENYTINQGIVQLVSINERLYFGKVSEDADSHNVSVNLDLKYNTKGHLKERIDLTQQKFNSFFNFVKSVNLADFDPQKSRNLKKGMEVEKGHQIQTLGKFLNDTTRQEHQITKINLLGKEFRVILIVNEINNIPSQFDKIEFGHLEKYSLSIEYRLKIQGFETKIFQHTYKLQNYTSSSEQPVIYAIVQFDFLTPVGLIRVSVYRQISHKIDHQTTLIQSDHGIQFYIHHYNSFRNTIGAGASISFALVEAGVQFSGLQFGAGVGFDMNFDIQQYIDQNDKIKRKGLVHTVMFIEAETLQIHFALYWKHPQFRQACKRVGACWWRNRCKYWNVCWPQFYMMKRDDLVRWDNSPPIIARRNIADTTEPLDL